MANDITIAHRKEATSAELHRRDDHWDIWFVGSASFIRTCESFHDDAVVDADVDGGSHQKVVEYIEERLQAAGYAVVPLSEVPAGALAAWHLLPGE